jgi:chromosome segregation ATPase
MKAKAAEAFGKENADTGLIAAVPAPLYISSPAKSLHVDVATLQSMLRQKEQELGVLREDNSAKQKELLHALELLQGAHKREHELRCTAQNLSNQLDLARDALQQSNSDIDSLQKEVEELAAVRNANLEEVAESALLEQLETAKAALAMARNDAELYKNKAATLQSALQASEEKYSTCQEKLALLQEYLTSLEEAEKEQRKSGSDNGRRAALGLTRTVLFARLAVQGLSLVCQALSSASS